MMVYRRRVFAICSAVCLACSAVAVAQPKVERKLTDAQKKEIQTIVKIVDEASAGQTAPNDLSMTWVHSDLLKAQNNREYVPFTVAIDPKAANGPVTIYWRLVSKDAAPAAAPAAGKKDDKDKDKDKKDKRNDFPYEDISAATPDPGGRISRSFTVAAGNYDLFVVIREQQGTDKKAPAPKISMLKQAVEVPNLWNGDLSTSSVIVAARIDPLPAPLTPQQQSDRPYALGTMEIAPSFDAKFSKKSELSTFLLIYNTKVDAANKPDVMVEYNFYAKQAGGEKFFNKTTPQNLNAQTLPPEFDFNAGHQLQSGQAVPLASFPEGDYRLEIKVTDKIQNKSLTRDVNFTVTGS